MLDKCFRNGSTMDAESSPNGTNDLHSNWSNQQFMETPSITRKRTSEAENFINTNDKHRKQERLQCGNEGKNLYE